MKTQMCLIVHDRIGNREISCISYEPVRSAEYPMEWLNVAIIDDLEEIQHIRGDFIDKHEERIEAEQLYILRENGAFLGLGIIEDNSIMKNCKLTGMLTHEIFRQKGIGRSIILHLKDICHASRK